MTPRFQRHVIGRISLSLLKYFVGLHGRLRLVKFRSAQENYGVNEKKLITTEIVNCVVYLDCLVVDFHCETPTDFTVIILSRLSLSVIDYSQVSILIAKNTTLVILTMSVKRKSVEVSLSRMGTFKI